MAGKYLVNDSNKIVYLVDPGIAGVASVDDDGKPTPKLDSPKARLFSLIIDGILTQKLPWGLVLIGVFLALVMELVGVSSLPFAVGLYLPLSSSAPIMAGGIVRAIVDKRRKSSASEAEFSPGVLLSSGFIAGGAIMGVVLSLMAGFDLDKHIDYSTFMGPLASAEWFAVLPFIGLMFILYLVGKANNNKT